MSIVKLLAGASDAAAAPAVAAPFQCTTCEGLVQLRCSTPGNGQRLVDMMGNLINRHHEVAGGPRVRRWTYKSPPQSDTHLRQA